ncbi:TPA: hypothetical protein DDZ49_02400 [Candidatus Wolfebacteria bacterium]|uniref:Uncharacterized protein n=1 Tax=Candidatus Wolfebacteria bacterium GW2011_GWB1_47_1 TaxID=1619007 RepID=A0A0G4ATZ2_9BACT|nr:MAG: protein of unknown function with transmembrane region [Candidatus Wolfebacteria bacterium GW2011_GWB1_47_1]HAL24260.1 hypothetical protein [Candidatus Wolfebacteria bacterium]HAS95530.1 hypothetical protein [Candidatus Wolfebacteria bacterium]HBD18608.1 hypothetical protein [Candidatus Wolfebacteria bacterium]HBN86995.1 hypothetical protein [Candidatus Wolfebacteria bacterium]
MDGSTITIKERFSRLYDAIAFKVLLLFIFIVLSCWPYLSFVNTASMRGLFLYLFGVWALLIVVLLVTNTTKEYSSNSKDNG